VVPKNVCTVESVGGSKYSGTSVPAGVSPSGGISAGTRSSQWDNNIDARIENGTMDGMKIGEGAESHVAGNCAARNKKRRLEEKCTTVADNNKQHVRSDMCGRDTVESTGSYGNTVTEMVVQSTGTFVLPSTVVQFSDSARDVANTAKQMQEDSSDHETAKAGAQQDECETIANAYMMWRITTNGGANNLDKNDILTGNVCTTNNNARANGDLMECSVSNVCTGHKRGEAIPTTTATVTNNTSIIHNSRPGDADTYYDGNGDCGQSKELHGRGGCSDGASNGIHLTTDNSQRLGQDGMTGLRMVSNGRDMADSETDHNSACQSMPAGMSPSGDISVGVGHLPINGDHDIIHGDDNCMPSNIVALSDKTSAIDNSHPNDDSNDDYDRGNLEDRCSSTDTTGDSEALMTRRLWEVRSAVATDDCYDCDAEQQRQGSGMDKVIKEDTATGEGMCTHGAGNSTPKTIVWRSPTTRWPSITVMSICQGKRMTMELNRRIAKPLLMLTRCGELLLTVVRSTWKGTRY
jgi:hypothetical protein